MAKEFKGLKKEDHEKLTRAAKMYQTLTGETIDVSSIPVEEPEKDAEADAKAAKDRLEKDAELTRKREDADRQLRQLQIDKARASGDVQDENPGPGQPAMVTERAKAQGHSRKGEEPASAAPTKGR